MNEALKRLVTERKGFMDEFRALVALAKDRQLSEVEEARRKELDGLISGLDERMKKLEELDTSLAAFEAAERIPLSTPERATQTGTEERSEIAASVVVGENRAEDRPYHSLGDFLRSVATAHNGVDPRLRKIEERAGTGLNEAVGSDGGFLVQQDFAGELMTRVYEVGQILQRVRRIPISAHSNGLKVNAVDETSRADGSRFGGVKAYWDAEGGDKTKSKPKFAKIELTLQKLIGLVYLTDELLADAVALEAFTRETFAQEMSFRIEDAFIEGTGAGMPAGIMASPSLVTVPKETGQPGATIRYANLCKMWSRMWARSRMNACWFINQDVEPELFNMGITIGTGGAPVYLPPGGASGSPFSTLFGRPVIPVEYCSTLGTTGDICLFDLTQYLSIDKGGMQSAASIHVRFVYDETALRFVYRIDGKPLWLAPLTPFKGTSTVSPFVTLATRA